MAAGSREFDGRVAWKLGCRHHQTRDQLALASYPLLHVIACLRLQRQLLPLLSLYIYDTLITMARRRRPPRPGALADLSPSRILKQIALLQFFYYGVAIVLIVFTTFVAGRHPNAEAILDWRELRGDVTTGWTLALCWLLGSLITYVVLMLDPQVPIANSAHSVIPILLLIARSKLVPDFALTIHFIHLIVTSLYTHVIPDTLYWWLVQGASAALMVSLGMWACQWRELQPMAFGGKAKSPTKTADEGEGYEMGTLRGAGRDGAGSYENVGAEASRKEPA